MIQGRDLLTVVELLEPVETEAAMRTQVGRLYYAVFLEVRGWCERNLGYSRVRLAREHQALANLLLVVDPDLVEQLRLLRLSRNAADYDEYLPMRDIQDHLARSRELSARILARLETPI